MFNHSHLPNVGLTRGKIPPDIYQALNKEIVDIHTNDRDIVKMNHSLAGQITKEYQLTESRKLLDPYLEEMARAYQKAWDYYPKENPNDNKLTVESVWVNMQKKLEVNPLHNHDGTLSFVAWLHIPFKLEDERKMENVKYSRTVVLASTFQFVYSQVLGNVVNFPLFLNSYNSACFVHLLI